MNARSRFTRAATSPSQPGERGSALVAALVLMVVLTVVVFTVVTRALLVARLAATERTSLKAFDAADAGIEASKARLRTVHTGSFRFVLPDLVGPTGGQRRGRIAVSVAGLRPAGAPRPIVGTQLGGGQGGATGLYTVPFTTAADAIHEPSGATARITVVLAAGPLPLAPTND